MRAFSFSCSQLPVVDSARVDLAERLAVFDDIGFVVHLKERDNRVALKPADLEKWVTNQVVRRGAKETGTDISFLAEEALFKRLGIDLDDPCITSFPAPAICAIHGSSTTRPTAA